MNGLPHHYPMMYAPQAAGGIAPGTDAAAAATTYPAGYGHPPGAFMHAPYGYAVPGALPAGPGVVPQGAAAPGMMVDPLMMQHQQQEMMMRQHQENSMMLAAAAPYGAPAAAMPVAGPAGAFPQAQAAASNDPATMTLARREGELVRLHDTHNRMMEAELASRAMRDRAAAQQQHQQAQQQAQLQFQEQQEAAKLHREGLMVRQSELVGPPASSVAAHGLLPPSAGAPFAPGYGQDRSRALTTSATTVASTSSSVTTEEMANGHLRQQRMLQRRILEEEVLNRQLKQEATLKTQQHARMMGHAMAMDSMSAQVGAPGLAAAHPGAPAPAAAAAGTQAHLNRLLQLQQMSDEDLMKRAAEVQNFQSVRENLERNKNVALEQHQRMESQQLLMRSSTNGSNNSGLSGYPGAAQAPGAAMVASRAGLDRIDQAQADAAIARRMSGGSGLVAHAPGASASLVSGNNVHAAAPIGSPAAQSVQYGMTLSQHSVSKSPAAQPLRYFKQGVEVDIHGTPLAVVNKNTASVSAVTTKSPALVDKDNNIIAKFVKVVVSRVPEIGPAVSDLLPDGDCDPTLLKQEYPNVVDAVLSELKAIEERFISGSDERALELRTRVKNCIAAIEDSSGGGGGAAGAMVQATPGVAASGGVVAGGPVGAVGGAPPPGFVPGMPGMMPAMMPHSPGFMMPTGPNGMHVVPPPGAMVPMVPPGAPYPPHGAVMPPPPGVVVPPHAQGVYSPQPQMLPPIVNQPSASGGGDAASACSTEGPAASDSLPLMEVYKTNKEAVLKEKKKSLKNSKKRSVPTLVHKAITKKTKEEKERERANRITEPTQVHTPMHTAPKLVHHALFRGGFAAHDVPMGAKPVVLAQKTSQAGWSAFLNKRGGDPVSSSKKRRISDHVSNGENDPHEQFLEKLQRHGQFLEKLVKENEAEIVTSRANNEAALPMASPESSTNDQKEDSLKDVKSSSADASNSVVTEESDNQAAQPSNIMDAIEDNNVVKKETDHMGAADVLLGLMAN